MLFAIFLFPAASLRVVPSRSQFFRYESVSMSCEGLGNSAEWIIKRNTSRSINENCSSWNGSNGSNCLIGDIYPHDSGLYWCESGSGECSNTINITVTGGSVILESPVHPLREGESVTLGCKTRDSTNLTTNFYKDELLIGSSSTGNLTIHSVTKSDEGLYKCFVSGVGQSVDSRLNVRETGQPAPLESPHIYILLPVVGVCLMLSLVMVFCLWRSLKGKLEPAVSYTDVTITEAGKHQTISVEDSIPTVYSTIQLGAT
ncbi:low affinity immunoglobulin gamma Fc region receptor II-b-like isoform X2 [Mugil cephalus]|uniref:low affinity immunoglobulin gamma Fc region receptor II-b-like isoform X2 n=1 Tax=Mugil cephalus TaxID=48193 RepID=UPI001FB7EF06|nr:low affinity immunoglobulin gamma Fc region receptor II-b-like isoform X2 [Mugil cephalus]